MRVDNSKFTPPQAFQSAITQTLENSVRSISLVYLCLSDQPCAAKYRQGCIYTQDAPHTAAGLNIFSSYTSIRMGIHTECIKFTIWP
jgi:hypothetical protein